MRVLEGGIELFIYASFQVCRWVWVSVDEGDQGSRILFHWPSVSEKREGGGGGVFARGCIRSSIVFVYFFLVMGGRDFICL